jgi:hypothetical protein
MSLSRLNYWLPRCEAYPQVMERTTDVHHDIADPLLLQADPIFDEAAALDTPVDRLDLPPPLVQHLVRHVLLPRERLAAWLLGRPEALHLRERTREEAEILSQPAPARERRWRGVGHALLMAAAAVRVAQQEEPGEGWTSKTFLTVWSFCLPLYHAVCAGGSWGRTMRRSVPSWAQGGTPARRRALRPGVPAPPPGV